MTMNFQNLEQNAEEAASFLKLLASGPRLLILCQLIGGEQNVGTLAEKTGLRMTTVSQHMALMRAQNIVSTRRDGTTIYYSLASPMVEEVLAVLYKSFCNV
ncbi:metalloregulator ArsR/SmtB family transcription factor [uncultured Cohaesibacter sp.]|uniref:ArsR/SmtB family transcription factor n=1 Tax=uncultured Cohaesibacter sp. TaxID=1002546 RepID=UPI0029313AC3|nr:metalloregulator ArsR/SmtB family transcription factor [uncultured Cohaesibacter sp.]